MDPHGAQLRFAFDEGAAPAPVSIHGSMHGSIHESMHESIDGIRADRPSIDREPVFVRHPRARRYVLRLLADGTPRVTIPRRGSRREAERFLEAQRDWVARQRASLVARLAGGPPRTWRDGHTLLLRGVSHALRRADDGSRGTVRLDDRAIVVSPRAEPETEDLRPAVTAWLWQLAKLELPQRLLALARLHGLDVRSVSVRNQRTRWGSCAPNGRISLNWRLVQTPPAVRDYVLLHELMHLRQANHSARFWRLVADACPDYQAARHWLRTHERQLLDA